MANVPHIRDFIYLDVDRLRSLLSQLESGVTESTERITARETTSRGSGDVGIAGILKVGGGAAYLWRTSETETRTLHDHVYGVLEDRLLEANAVALIRGSDATAVGTQLDQLHPGDLVLARGKVVINDWQRMRSILKNFKKLEKALLRCGSSRSGKGLGGRATESPSASVSDSVLKDLGFVFDNLFTGRGLVVKMSPAPSLGRRRLVGTLDPDCLREPIEYITYKHTTSPRNAWNMLAIVAARSPLVPPEAERETSVPPHMEDAIDNMFTVMRAFEYAGISVVEPEIAVTPIALYL